MSSQIYNEIQEGEEKNRPNQYNGIDCVLKKGGCFELEHTTMLSCPVLEASTTTPLTLDMNHDALVYKFVVEPRRMCVALVLPYFY